MEKNTETTIMGMSLGDLGKYMFTMYVGPSGCQEGLGVVAPLPFARDCTSYVGGVFPVGATIEKCTFRASFWP